MGRRARHRVRGACGGEGSLPVRTVVAAVGTAAVVVPEAEPSFLRTSGTRPIAPPREIPIYVRPAIHRSRSVTSDAKDQPAVHPQGEQQTEPRHAGPRPRSTQAPGTGAATAKHAR